MKLISGDFEALGTTIMYGLPEVFFKDGTKALKDEAARIENKYSRFIESSAVCQLNQSLNVWVEVDAEFHTLLAFAQNLQTQTGEALNFGTTTLLEHWGYNAAYDLKSSAIKIGPELLVIRLKPEFVKINVPIDFGAFGKGYFLDQARLKLTSLGIEIYRVNAGGDITFKTDLFSTPFKYFFEDPRINKRVIGECELRDGFLCASSTSKRAWGNFHHLIDTAHSKPAQNMQAVYVQSDESGLVTDALSTAFFVMGFEKASSVFSEIKALYPSLELMCMSAQGQIWRSEGFKGTLYTA